MINVSMPIIGNKEIEEVTKAVASGWVSSQGEYINKLEESFANFCEVEHCVLVSNGTVAIHLALEVLGIGAGDEVIIPDLTFVATANAVKMCGASPVLADVRFEDWCIDPNDVRSKITTKTKAIIPVHLYGHPAAMDELKEIAEEFGLNLIEDAAEAHGARYKGRRVGGIGTLGTFSFYGNKIITTGEGGAITTNSAEIADRARFLRDHGMSRDKRYWYTEIGYNYRMTNMQAALGYAQMSSIDKFILQRKEILELYRKNLDVPNSRINPAVQDCSPVNWIICLVLDDFTCEDRDKLQANLYNEGIDSRPFFYSMSELPMYKQKPNPVSKKLSKSGINLPTYPGLSEKEVILICEAVNRIVRDIRSF